MLYLKPANGGDIEKEYLFVRDMPADENGVTSRWSGIARADFDKVLQHMIDVSEGKDLQEGHVPQTYLFLWLDDEIVGQFRVRHYLNEALQNGAGHIGYFIKKEYRGRGYATEGLKQALTLARNIVPENEIFLRVRKNNPASLRVMQKNGGYIQSEDQEAYYVRIEK